MNCLAEGCNFVTPTNDNKIFVCTNCGGYNCMNCMAMHRNLTCDEYKLDSENGQIYCKDEMERVKQKQMKLNYEKIMTIEMNLLPNINKNHCIICFVNLEKHCGINLRCGSIICRNCLIEHIKSSNKIPIPNPSGAGGYVTEQEIKEVLEQKDLTIYLNRCLNECKTQIYPNKFVKCQNSKCNATYHLIISYNKNSNNQFKCPFCYLEFCLKCYESHPNFSTCLQYAESIKNTPEGKDMWTIENEIYLKKRMRCLSCRIIIEKLNGCNWVICCNCKVELCWITQKFRWGPKGNGDTSGGCQCKINGIACHPDCKWSCH